MVIAVIEVIIMNDDHDRGEYPVRGGWVVGGECDNEKRGVDVDNKKR